MRAILLDEGGGDHSGGGAGGGEDGLDIGCERGIHLAHLHLVIEIGGIAQAAHDQAGLVPQAASTARPSNTTISRAMPECAAIRVATSRSRLTRSGFDQRLLAMMRADPQHQAVANASDAGNDVEMAESDGIRSFPEVKRCRESHPKALLVTAPL